MLKYACAVAVICFAVSPVFAEDWGQISHDLKELHADYKDLHTDKLDLESAVKAGNMNAAIKDAEEVRTERHDIHEVLDNLKEDGVTIHKGKH